MARRIRAARVKTRLSEIAYEILQKNGIVNSHSLVQKLIGEKFSFDETELAEVRDIGLTVLAGRIPSSKKINKEEFQYPLLNDIQELTNVKMKIGTKVCSSSVKTLEIIPKKYFSDMRKAPNNKKETSRTEMEEIFRKMIEEGFGDMTYGEYLKKK